MFRIPGGGEGGETWYSGFQAPISSSKWSTKEGRKSLLEVLGSGIPNNPRVRGALLGCPKMVLG
jgi:hypothetical protein